MNMLMMRRSFRRLHVRTKSAQRTLLCRLSRRELYMHSVVVLELCGWPPLVTIKSGDIFRNASNLRKPVRHVYIIKIEVNAHATLQH